MLANALFSADLVSKEAAEGALEGYLDVSEGALLAGTLCFCCYKAAASVGKSSTPPHTPTWSVGALNSCQLLRQPYNSSSTRCQQNNTRRCAHQCASSPPYMRIAKAARVEWSCCTYCCGTQLNPCVFGNAHRL